MESKRKTLTHIFAALTHIFAQKIPKRRRKPSAIAPLLSEANLCVKIDFGQRYGSQHFE
jgi:hypothetical protein